LRLQLENKMDILHNTKFLILETIKNREGLSASQISKIVDTPKSYVLKILPIFVRVGLIERNMGINKKESCITPLGSNVYNNLKEVRDIWKL